MEHLRYGPCQICLRPICQCPRKVPTISARLTPAQVQEIEEWVASPRRLLTDESIRLYARLIASHRALEARLEEVQSAADNDARIAAQQHDDLTEKLTSTVRALALEEAEATRLREALGKIEWTSEKETLYCQWCAAYKDERHKPNCFIGQALTG